MSLNCDVDGVAADFVTASQVACGVPVEPAVSWDYFEHWIPAVSGKEFWSRIKAFGDTFYDEMVPAFSWTDELLAAMLKADENVLLLSDTSAHVEAYQSKVRWCEKYLPGVELFTGKNKWKLSAPGKLLIDDNDDNIRLWQAKGGSGILFPQPWNLNRGIQDRMGFVLEKLDEWRICNDYSNGDGYTKFRNQGFGEEGRVR